MVAKARNWDHQADVVVVGSGAAGMTAAILAHDHGAKVVIIERTDKVGGTTAVSGGGIWVPLNHHMHEVKIDDSREEALAYCKALAMGKVDQELIETFVDTAATMIRYIEEHTSLKFGAMTAPDYQPEVEGGKLGGRSNRSPSTPSCWGNGKTACARRMRFHSRSHARRRSGGLMRFIGLGPSRKTSPSSG